MNHKDQDQEQERAQEAEWVSRCQNGDRQAFRPLVQRYERMVRSMVRRLISADHEVDEVAQQVFVAAYENLAKYRGTARFSTWLCQIALNKSRDVLRHRQRRAEVDIDDLDLESTMADPERGLEEKQRDACLQAALGQLKPVDREVVVLKYIVGLGYEEVAKTVGCTLEAAKVRSHRAREVLRKVLEAMGVVP